MVVMKFSLVFLFSVAFSIPVTASEIISAEKIIRNQHQLLINKISSIEAETLNKWIETKKDFILLDVREPEEIIAVNIDINNKINIPRGTVEFNVQRLIQNKNQHIVVMCSHGIRSTIVTDILNKFGYINVYNLKDGLFSWVNSGHRVSNFYGSFKIDEFKSSIK